MKIVILIALLIVFVISGCVQSPVITPGVSPSTPGVYTPTPTPGVYTPTPTPVATPGVSPSTPGVYTPAPEPVPQPNFSLNQEGLVDIDFEKAGDMAGLIEEFNRKGLLIYQVGSYGHNEETATVTFFLDLFFTVVPEITGDKYKTAGIVRKSLFVFSARILDPQKIIIVERDWDRGHTWAYVSPDGKIDDIKAGNFNHSQWMRQANLFLKPKEIEIVFPVIPITVELYKVPAMPGGLLDIQISGDKDPESFMAIFNEVGFYNFKITRADYDDKKQTLTILLKTYYSVLKDKKTGKLIYNFKSEIKDEFKAFDYQIVGSIMTQAARTLNPDMIQIVVANPDGSTSTYISMIGAMEMLKKAGVDWNIYCQRIEFEGIKF
jgi:hypothetical protein